MTNESGTTAAFRVISPNAESAFNGENVQIQNPADRDLHEADVLFTWLHAAADGWERIKSGLNLNVPLP